MTYKPKLHDRVKVTKATLGTTEEDVERYVLEGDKGTVVCIRENSEEGKLYDVHVRTTDGALIWIVYNDEDVGELAPVDPGPATPNDELALEDWSRDRLLFTLGLWAVPVDFSADTLQLRLAVREYEAARLAREANRDG